MLRRRPVLCGPAALTALDKKRSLSSAFFVSGSGARRTLQHIDLFSPARQHHVPLPLRKLESDALHESRIRHFLPFPAFDRRDETREW
ncbi:MAG: hypothetical protein QOJ04_2670 [Caballeronia sp.]|nr:hypothetical protein [Caballeronia sp.]